ncbi:MAG: alpha/beta fold hydrolase [Candidatus Margulisbacteria bacterium]|nr:alpha/beta fold hydrolase [Candidatus Margulisiibacteriota bacterium]
MKRTIILILLLAISTAAIALQVYFKDPEYSFQLLRTMGEAPGGGSDISECLKTADKIKEGDGDSWYREWGRVGQQLERAGDSFLKKGHKISASEAYLRSSNYFRNADFFLHGNPGDPRILRSWRKSREMFQKAMRLQAKPLVEFIRIPFEKTTLPGYYCRVDDSGKKRPLLIIHSGFDGTAEELYYSVAFAALKRGYNCLLFEGPGQGGVIREQHIPFRHNWESAVTPVVDYALTLPETIPDRIGLIGISFGGYLAPRAAAFEPRLKVLVANGGVWDFHLNFVKGQPADFDKLLDEPEAAGEIDKEIYDKMKNDISLRWVFNNGMYTFAAKTPLELIRMTRPYKMAGVVDQIKCRVLVVDSEEDKDMAGQARQLYQALRCPKDFMLFTVKEGAEEHCQMGAQMVSSERIFNWLDENL